MPLTMSPAGRAALRIREGCRLAAYQDPVGVWTIGVGHTGRASGRPVTPGMTITLAEAETLLDQDLAPFEAAVRRTVERRLAFNIGVTAFAGSSVVRRLNAGDVPGAADAFLLWNRPPALKARRLAERAQFLGQAAKTAASVPAVPPRPVSQPAAAAPPSRPSWWDRLWIALTFRKAAP